MVKAVVLGAAGMCSRNVTHNNGLALIRFRGD